MSVFLSALLLTDMSDCGFCMAGRRRSYNGYDIFSSFRSVLWCIFQPAYWAPFAFQFFVVVVVVRWHTHCQRSLRETSKVASVTDLAGWRESSFRDTSVDPKRCSRVVASAGHSVSQCSKVCWPSPHFGHVGWTKVSMTCRYARSRLLWLERSCACMTASLMMMSRWRCCDWATRSTYIGNVFVCYKADNVQWERDINNNCV